MTGIQLSAVDTLYFRDSTPYAPTLTSPEHPGGQFPPHPATVVGALRAMLARGQGWRHGPWSPDIVNVLGAGYGPDDLGRLSFDGPYLLCEGQPVFPMPAHLLGRVSDKKWQPVGAMCPGPPVVCDLGDAVCLPIALDIKDPCHPTKKSDPPKPAKDQWLTRAGMRSVLHGKLPAPDNIIPSSELWTTEMRVGIERDKETRTVRDGMLYTSRHVRPAKDVTIGMRIDGVPEEWQDHDGTLVPLGGEGRWTERTEWPEREGEPGNAVCAAPLEQILADRKVMVIALTPIDADAEMYRPGGRIADLGDATIVSACLPRVERVGGWAGTPRPGPLPLRSILPAGSTFFCEINDPEALRAAVGRADMPRIGNWQRWGFGAVAIGVWPADMTKTREGTQ